ncbi:putative G-protein coupled receptor 34b [Parambassis ranga]|uniref:Probable G-protein coupled receptor 34 n=1 Tax=Parambassis ranga TaxID=210632 RepID=A0A6P7HEL1_9TELE|nr:probable G-protein coupled receptor 34 [Parambassis ranga]
MTWTETQKDIMTISTTTPANSSYPCVDYNAMQIPLAVLYSIIFIMGLAGNVVALWVFFCVHSKKNSVRVFLINVAFADLLLVFCLPFRILYHSQGNRWNLDPTLCKVVGQFFYMNMYISVTMLGLISLNRYVKIHRKSGMQCSTRGSAVFCAFVWIVAFCFILPILISRNPPNENRCFHYKVLIDQKWKAYINISVLVIFWLVFIALIVSYGKIALKLLRTSKNQPALPNAARYTRTAKKSFFILFLFTICFVPYHLVRGFYIRTQITTTSCFWMDVADKANEVALLFSALNSCLDPIMYFLLSSSVRKEVLRLVSSVLCTRSVAVGSGSSSTADFDCRNGRTDNGQPNITLIPNSSREKAASIANIAGL